MSNELDVLLEEKVEFKVGEKQYRVGKLSYKQFVEFARFLSTVSKKYKDIVIGGETNTADLIFLLGVTDVQDAATLFSIFLNEPDKSYIEKFLLSDMEKCSDILAAVCNKNDIKKIFGNFLKATDAITINQAAAPLPSSQK